MKKLVLATKNLGKLKELKALLRDVPLDIVSLNDYPGLPEIEEDGRSFFENALKKAKAVSEWTGEASLADDSGLEIEILGGRPGIYSARYSGPDATDQSNIEQVLKELRVYPEKEKSASFRCVLVLYSPDGRYEAFEGSLDGVIIDSPKGTQGFGYDPIFFLPEFGKTVAEIPEDVKNRISHRAQAFIKLKNKIESGIVQ